MLILNVGRLQIRPSRFLLFYMDDIISFINYNFGYVHCKDN